MPGAVRQTTLLRPVRSLCNGTQNTSREARGILRGIVCGRESQKHNQRGENVGSELRSPLRGRLVAHKKVSPQPLVRPKNVSRKSPTVEKICAILRGAVLLTHPVRGLKV